MNDLLDALEPVLGHQIARRTVPYPVAAASAIMAERMQRLRNPAEEPRLTRHAVAALGLSLTLDISAARRDLGYQPQVPLAEGLKRLRPMPLAVRALPAKPRANSIRLELLRVGDCVSAGTALRRDAAPLPRVVPALVAVLDHGDEVCLFDTGYGRNWAEVTRRLPEFLYRMVVPSRLPDRQQLDRSLRRLQLAPVSRVLLSHLHADHVSGLFDLDETPPALASREALAHLARLDARAAGVGTRLTAMAEALPLPLVRRLQGLVRCGQLTEIEALPPCALPPSLAALGQGHDLIGDGSAVTVPLPGHGRGQVGLWLPASSRGPVLLAADAAFSGAALRDGVLPPGPVLSRLGDPVAYRRTFAILARLAAEGVGVIAAHDPDVATA